MSTDQTKTTAARKWVRVCLWALLVAWWVALAWYLREPSEPAPAVVRRPPSKSPASVASAPTAKTSVVEALPRVEPAPLSPAAGATSAPPPTVVREDRLPKIREEVAELAIKGELAKAAALLDAELAKDDARDIAAELTATRQFVADLAQVNGLIASAFKSKIGQRVSLEMDNRRHLLTVRAVEGTEVKGELLVKAGDAERAEPVAFSVDTLDPIERSRWLGRADTPAKCAMKFLLHLKGGDYASASEFAAQAGPLAQAFSVKVKALAAGTRTP